MSIYVFIALIAIVAFLLVLIIMVQNPKGGGLDGTFGGGGGNMLGGVQQTTDFLDKATWYLFGLMIVLVLLSNSVVLKNTKTSESPVKAAIENRIPDANKEMPTKNPAIDNSGTPANDKMPEKKN